MLPPAGMLPLDLDWDAVDKLSQAYALGVSEIDRQHRMLFAWCVALRKRPGEQVAAGLLAYAAGHFAAEEAWAADRGIDIALHQQQHDALLDRLERLRDGATRIAVAALAYDWLVVHIDVEDRALVALDRTA